MHYNQKRIANYVYIDSDISIVFSYRVASNGYSCELLELVEATVPVVEHVVEVDEACCEFSDGSFGELVLVSSD